MSLLPAIAEPWDASPDDSRPRVWALLGAHHGDNQQVLSLADALGWHVEPKQLYFNLRHALPNSLLGPSLSSLTRASRQLLQPPWPDLIIGAGQRTVPASLWVRKASANKTRLVRIGRPRAPLQWFDLIVTTPQYGLPQLDNVLELPLPVHIQQPAAPAELDFWKCRFEGLPRPWVGVLIGGSSWPYLFHQAATQKLAGDLNVFIAGRHGSALVCTSPRTVAASSRTLKQHLNIPCYYHQFAGGRENPYRAVLQFADEFVVTSDSLSMLTEACSTHKPIYIYPLPKRRDPFSLFGRWLGTQANSSSAVALPLARLATNGIMSPPKSLSRVHQRLLANGCIHRFRADTPDHATVTLVRNDKNLHGCLQRIRSLLPDNGSATKYNPEIEQSGNPLDVTSLDQICDCSTPAAHTGKTS